MGNREYSSLIFLSFILFFLNNQLKKGKENLREEDIGKTPAKEIKSFWNASVQYFYDFITSNKKIWNVSSE